MPDAPTTEFVRSVSLIEIIGIFPMIIASIAIVLGLSALITRNKTWIQSSLIFQFAIGALGIGITCWRLHISNSIYYDTYPDASMWAYEFSYTWTAAAVSLMGVSIGTVFIGIAWLIKKSG